MNITFLKKDLVYRAAINARGERLNKLRKQCVEHNSMSTNKLRKELDRLAELMKDDAVVMNQAYEALKNG